MKKKHFLFFSLFFLFTLTQFSTLHAQIEWTTFDKLSSKKMTVILIWKKDEPWSNRMEATTLSDPAIVKYGNKKFNFVKLEATENASEMNRLGITLKGYPTTVILNKKEELVQDIPGYMIAKDFEEILGYFGEETYKEKTWAEYKKQYDLVSPRSSDVPKNKRRKRN